MKGSLSAFARLFSVKSKKPSRNAFQILSDLHLEVGQQYTSFVIPPQAPYLILAGDIGRLIDYEGYLAFLAAQTSQYTRVFLVLGNHEFYGLTHEAGLERAEKLQQEQSLAGKLTVLQRCSHYLPDCQVVILGCSLWSHIPNDAADVVRGRVKDFQKITDWSIDKHNASHQADHQWLHRTLDHMKAGGDASRVIVVTHHAPCLQQTSRPEHFSNPWTCAFASDVLTAEDSHVWDVQWWVFGHTHYTNHFQVGSTQVVSNQRGYVLPGSSSEAKGKAKDRTYSRNCFDVSRVILVT